MGAVASAPLVPSLSEKKIIAELTSDTSGGGDLSEPAQTLPEVIPESKPNPAPVTVSPPEPKKPATKGPEVLQSAMKQIAKERGEKGFTGLGCF